MSRHGNRDRIYTPSFERIISDGVKDGQQWIAGRTRKIVVVSTSIIVILSLGIGGGYYWWDTQGKAERVQLAAESECSQQVSEMTASYQKAFRLHSQIFEKLSTLDESYDLDTLIGLQDKSPESYPTFQCSTNIKSDERKAKKLKQSYDELSKEYERALSHAQE